MRQQTVSKNRTIHMNNLAEVFKLPLENVCDIYRHLKQIETQGHKLAEDYCNGKIHSDEIEVVEDKLKDRVEKVLVNADFTVVKNIKFNWDPRGYFLKINDDFVRLNKLKIETDWGGFGIICPEDI